MSSGRGKMLRPFLSRLSSSLPVAALDHVCICVSDISSSIDWYTSVLSLTHAHKSAEHFWPTDPQSPAFLSPGLALFPLSTSTSPIRDHKGAHFALSVDASTFSRAKNGGLQALLHQHRRHSRQSTFVEYEDYGIQKSLFFKDPDANVIELTLWGDECHDADLRSLERVTFETLDGISLRMMTPASPLYTSSYSDSPFHELPWFGFLWPGGNAIAKHVLSNPKIVQGKTVLDFACGCGVGSIVSLQSGASRVVANDIAPLCLEATRLNYQESLNQGWESVSASRAGVSQEEGEGEEEQRMTSNENDIEYVCDDLVGTSLLGQVDVCLAGDVLYDDELARRVFPWFQEMADKGCEVLVGDPGRWVLNEGTYDAVIEHIASYPLDPKVSDEHHGLHTGNVWRVLPRS